MRKYKLLKEIKNDKEYVFSYNLYLLDNEENEDIKELDGMIGHMVDYVYDNVNISDKLWLCGYYLSPKYFIEVSEPNVRYNNFSAKGRRYFRRKRKLPYKKRKTLKMWL